MGMNGHSAFKMSYDSDPQQLVRFATVYYAWEKETVTDYSLRLTLQLRFLSLTVTLRVCFLSTIR